MKDKEHWENLGNELKNIVEDAIASNDFRELSKNITTIVNGSIEEVRTQIKNASEAGLNSQPIRDFTNIIKTPKQNHLIRKPHGKIKTLLQEIFGYCIGGMSLASSVFSLSIASFQTAPTGSLVTASVFGLTGAVCIGLGIKGTKKRGQLNRFNKYIKTLGNHLYYDIQDFAKKLGYSPKIIQQDLKTMIDTGIFLEGHLDKQESCLMITDKVYEQYLETQQHFEEEQHQKTIANSYSSISSNVQMDEECKAVLKEGEEYIEHIQYFSKQIRNQDMRHKLNHLELVITRIFAEIKKSPNKVSDLRRMMNFYLPTTKKLIHAYSELEKQPIVGQNIENTRHEIEASFDTLNEAFEKLLDDLFQDTAWDISSDISVLNTMLAQDGYKNDKLNK